MQKGLHHIIFISFKSETPESARDEIYTRYQTLAEDCGGENAGILFWSVQKNLDQRKNIHLVEYAMFRDKDALENFKKHPQHVELVNDFLVHHADWKVGDFLI